MQVVLISSDLMLLSSVQGAVTNAGAEFLCVATESRLKDAVAAAGGDKSLQLLLDLNCTGVSCDQAAAAVSGEVLARSVAFGPHVHEARLEAARSAGFGTVVSRGSFVSRLPRLIAAETT